MQADTVQDHADQAADIATDQRRLGMPPIEKIVVAIHGIGSQQRSSTIRSVARRFGEHGRPSLPMMPLGFFHGESEKVQYSRLDTEPDDRRATIGFAEVFWADIPRRVVKSEDTLEETKAWGASVVSRAHAAYLKKLKQSGTLTADDFEAAANVVDETIETLAVLENLLKVTEKAGIFKFQLGPLLRDYIGDVQVVTEFRRYRDEIVYRFHAAMTEIVQTYQATYPGRTPEIHVVAHSEGTVIAFMALLTAMSGLPFDGDPNRGPAVAADWIRHVRGFMTIGSPIDKHLILWERLWDDVDIASRIGADGRSVVFDNGTGLTLPAAIKWRNYYDLGDPIGFKLETAVDLLAARRCVAFEFVTAQHDHGFSRYWLPGKAHNDYWDDGEVFGHFIDDVVLPDPANKPAPPRSHALVDKVSTLIPYAITAALHLAAVLVLYRTLFPLRLSPSNGAALADMLQNVGLLSALLLSVTVASRLPRLVKTAGWRWHLAAFVAFCLGALPATFALPDEVAGYVGQPLNVRIASWLPGSPAHHGHAALLLVTALLAFSGWVLPKTKPIGRRLLIGSGAVLILLVCVKRLLEDGVETSVWPVLLAGLAFLYLWWLGLLLFDLTFVWHRYIRRSVALDTLRQWSHNRDARPDRWMGLSAQKSGDPRASTRRPDRAHPIGDTQPARRTGTS